MSRIRRSSPGLRPAVEQGALRFEGRSIAAADSDTIASALLAAGEVGCRESADGGVRGVFCGMGVCRECLVEVDGVDGVRGCVTAARPGMEVRRQPARPAGHAGAAPHAGGSEVVEAELLVVGGGPAGLAAAAAAAEAGVRTVLVDERAKAGGQYYKQPAGSLVERPRRLDAQYRAGRALADRVRAAGVRILHGVEIWGAGDARRLLGTTADGADMELRTQRLVLAPGAYERGLPLPGWTLPGVLTTGAAQTLLRAHQVAPGERVLVSGNGPLNMQVAAELARAGVRVVALAELASPARVGRAGSLAAMAALAPDLAVTGIGYQLTLRRAGVPTLFGHALIRAEGAERVTAAVVARIGPGGTVVPGSERRYEVDAVCVGFGFLPSAELARSLGCEQRWDERLGHLETVRDARGRTTVDGVWVAGDGGGIAGARAARAGGTLAGLDVAASLGRAVDARARRSARRAQGRHLRFQRALWDVYAAPRLVDELADDDTPICRCENVSLGELRAQLGQGIGHAGALKRVTRAGMGGCQGRYCGSLLAELTARQRGTAIDEAAMLAPAAPFKPLPVAFLAREP